MKSGKHLLMLLLLMSFISSKCLAQSKVQQPKGAEVSKEAAPSKAVVPTKKVGVAKSVATSKVIANPKTAAESKKMAEVQVSVLKDEISGMPAISGFPVTPVINVIDSVAMVKDLKVKPFKVNAHASYYHDKLNGRRTASGKPFDNKKLTAAHRTFPFGTQLRLTNTANNKSVVVTVTDRGPFTKSREIDITKAAFMQIATNKNSGSVNITIEVVQ